MGELVRFDFFQEIRRKFTLPAMEMRDDRPVNECYKSNTLWPAHLNQLHMLVKVARKYRMTVCIEKQTTESEAERNNQAANDDAATR